MKKFTAFLLSALILLSFAGCGKEDTIGTIDSNENSVVSADIGSSTIESTDTASQNGATSEKDDADLESKTSSVTSTENTEKPIDNTNSKTPTSTPGSSKVQASNSSTNTPNKNTNTSSKTPAASSNSSSGIIIKDPIFTNLPHKTISYEMHYHYSTLNAKQKKVYDTIITAIKNINNIIDVSSYGLSRDEGQKILQMALADHPEYFYVSKYTATSYNSETNILNTLYLYYTDGKTIDKLDEDHNLISTASRANIASKMQVLNKKVDGILKLIPTRATAVAKEKFIHDYLVTHVVFDKKVASSASFKFGEVLPHDWDMYGALIEGSAVCEGYAKAFSYLCHRVGINATVVLGATSEGDHMWDEVQIDGKWYLVDVAWDDYDGSGDLSDLKLYQYFNISTIGLTTHISNKIMIYPSATGTENSYKNTYAINMENGKLSSNYKFVIDEIAKNKERFLQIYTGPKGISDKTLIDTFHSANSPVLKYIKQKGYKMKIEPKTFSYGNYTCLVVSYN
jgi:transglutaminase/protease-like cytokinesis protein 3